MCLARKLWACLLAYGGSHDQTHGKSSCLRESSVGKSAASLKEMAMVQDVNRSLGSWFTVEVHVPHCPHHTGREGCWRRKELPWSGPRSCGEWWQGCCPQGADPGPDQRVVPALRLLGPDSIFPGVFWISLDSCGSWSLDKEELWTCCMHTTLDLKADAVIAWGFWSVLGKACVCLACAQEVIGQTVGI